MWCLLWQASRSCCSSSQAQLQARVAATAAHSLPFRHAPHALRRPPQVWDNCRKYNGPPEESPITADCETTRAVFEAAWAEKGLSGVAPLDPAAGPAAREAWAQAAAAGTSSPGLGPPEAPGGATPSGRSGRNSRAGAGGGRHAAQQPEAAAGGRGSSRPRSALAQSSDAADWVASAKQVRLVIISIATVLHLPPQPCIQCCNTCTASARVRPGPSAAPARTQ